MTGDARLHYPATSRNRDAILGILRRVLPPDGLVLEIASGSGEHVAHFAPALPHLQWQPSDADPAVLDSIAAHAGDGGNIRPPLRLDVLTRPWPVDRAVAVLCINMVHIAPWPVCRALLAGSGAVLDDGGMLYLYGPFKRDGRHTAPSNAAFDAALRRQNPALGVRALEDIEQDAMEHGLRLAERVDMPANNLSVILRKGG